MLGALRANPLILAGCGAAQTLTDCVRARQSRPGQLSRSGGGSVNTGPAFRDCLPPGASGGVKRTTSGLLVWVMKQLPERSRASHPRVGPWLPGSARSTKGALSRFDSPGGCVRTLTGASGPCFYPTLEACLRAVSGPGGLAALKAALTPDQRGLPSGLSKDLAPPGATGSS